MPAHSIQLSCQVCSVHCTLEVTLEFGIFGCISKFKILTLPSEQVSYKVEIVYAEVLVNQYEKITLVYDVDKC